MKIHVRLRDTGTIFHDTSANVTVTGSVPVQVTTTKKVNAALAKGILVKVDDEKAKAEIAKAKGERDKQKAAADKKVNAKVADIQKKLDDALADNASKEETITELTGKLTTVTEERDTAKQEIAAAIEEGEKLGEVVPKSELDKAVEEAEKAKTQLVEKDTALTNANTELEKVNKQLTAKTKALETTKKALADAEAKLKKAGKE